MLQEDVKNLVHIMLKKIDLMEKSLGSYLVLSALAGVYVAFGIGLILFLGAPFAAASSPAAKLVMGSCFGIALTLVIFAGSELFTGNNMFGVTALLSGHVSA